MRKFLFAFFLSFISQVVYADFSEHFYSVHNMPHVMLEHDTFIHHKAILNTEYITVSDCLKLENFGEIYADIFIEPGQTLSFKNSGAFYGTIYSDQNSHLIQLVNSKQDIGVLDFQGDGYFSVMVGPGTTINISDIAYMSVNADKIILDNSVIRLGPNFTELAQNIEIIGNVWIDLSNLSLSDGMLLLSGVSGNGSVNILTDNLSPLYYPHTVQRGNSIFLELFRETDYEKALGGNVGKFLNNVRKSGGNKRMLDALDRQTTLSGVQNVIKHSAAFNPVKLVRPVQIFEKFESMGPTESGFSADFEPIYIFGNDMELFAGRASLDLSISDWTLGLVGYAGSFEFMDELDDFSGKFFGGNIGISYARESIWIDSVVGYSISSFDTGPIFKASSDEPTGQSIYAKLDMGLNFEQGSMYIKPFVGISGNVAKVENDVDSDLYIRGGGIFGYKYSVMGLSYDYSLFGEIQTNSDIVLGARLGVWSEVDLVGGNASVRALKTELGTYYKISLEIKAGF